jgi:hypothetical protein
LLFVTILYLLPKSLLHFLVAFHFSFFFTIVNCTEAQLLLVVPGSVEHQFAQCRTKYRAHIAASFERSVGRTVHYTVLSAATETSVTVVKSGVNTGLLNGRNLFVVNLSASTNLWTCVDGCRKANFKDRPFVHILKTLQSKGLPFFDPRYFHSHWRVTPSVTSKHIQRWCKEHDPDSDSVPSDDYDIQRQ